MLNKYIVIMTPIHEKRIDVSKPYDTYEAAIAALKEDMKSTANGWEGVNAKDVYFKDWDDGTGTVSYEDETFIWAVHEI